MINMLGQDVNFSAQTTASGYYVYSNEEVAAMQASGQSNCPDGMRPGVLHIRGLETIPTCGGRIYTEQLPDIHIVDWRYRQYVQLALVALALTMLVAVGLKLLK